MKFSFYIALRYLFSSVNTQAVNIITKIAASAIVVSAAILTIVLSAFDGLKELHLEFTSISDPDLKVFPKKGKFFELNELNKKQLLAIEGISSVTEVIENQVLLNYKQKRLNAFIKGVDSNYPNVIPVDSILAYGDWINNKKLFVVVGNQIGNKLSLGINNYESLLDLYMPKPGKGQITNPAKAFTSKSVVVSGIYQLTNELDQKYVYCSIDLARELLKLNKQTISNIEIKVIPGSDLEIIKNQIVNLLNVEVKDRIQLNDAIYKMLNTEHLAAYLLSTLVLIIALFNLIGSIIMLISDKKSNLITLLKIGSTIKQIRYIFFFLGNLISILSGTIGILMGLLLVLLQQKFALIMITPYLAYPTKFSFSNIITVFVTLTILGIIASAIASASIKKELSTKY